MKTAALTPDYVHTYTVLYQNPRGEVLAGVGFSKTKPRKNRRINMIIRTTKRFVEFEKVTVLKFSASGEFGPECKIRVDW